MSTSFNREPSQSTTLRASTPTPSVASVGEGKKKGGTKKGKKSRAASNAPSAAGDGQPIGVHWAPLDASVSDPTGFAAQAGASNPQEEVVSGGTLPVPAGKGGLDDEGDDEEDLLPDMADDDYSTHVHWQSQNKDNMKELMLNFDADQYDRFEAYRRNALPKQAVRRVIQASLGQQVSAPVAQIVAGFGKVFVGEIVEKARAVQEARGESGSLSPDHLREAYRQYQQESGRVGAARPIRGKRLFVR